ncbi:ATP-binding protein [Emticicia oligotrophica]|uniref:ATP-binding protein n=1 Tax=Emticicia oligotrophica TaxID=312279 RepID=UPI00273B6FC3|nr:ATP-binding protein [Emticicia oligotrophica]
MKETQIIRNKSFDYFSINDSEFTDLVFNLFNNEIQSNGELVGLFDKVSPSPETREKGKDITLHYQDIITGVIQCKLIKDKNVGLNELLKELIKFILYGIQDNLFENQAKFDYYIVAPRGFTEEVHSFTNKNSRKLKDIDLIINRLLSKPTIKLIYEGTPTNEIREKVVEILNWISIKPIKAVQLDSWLNKDHNRNLVSDNFKYAEFTDEPVKEILKDFQNASNNVAIWNNTIDGIPNSHIIREEVDLLFNKIETPIQTSTKHSNIFLLVGGAGCGKSCIMRDLYHRLHKSNIPTLAIKSDKYENLISLKVLQEQLNLQDTIVKQINTLTQGYHRVVLLIDQIDAISLFPSSKNSNWNTYQTLISSLKYNNKVRIIISIRKFDLDTDSDLKQLGHYNKVDVSELKEEEIEKVLNYKNIKYATLPKPLKSLLKMPSNLNIFCKIDSNKINIDKLTTINALYKELWRQKITNCPRVFKSSQNRCKEAILKICKEIYEQNERLTISDEFLIDDFADELKYLKSCGILLGHERELEFFHSKFFEYSLAKNFVEKRKTLTEYIFENNQFLEIRPIVRTVLELQKDTSKSDYIDSCIEILQNEAILFHLKLLVIDVISFQTNLISKEKQIFETIILKKQLLRKYFFETVSGAEWLNYLIEKQHLNYLIKNEDFNLCRWILSRYLPAERNVVLFFLGNQIFDFEKKYEFICQVLYDLKTWDNKLAFQLFDECYKNIEIGSFFLYHILEEAALFEPDWVIGKFDQDLRKNNFNKEDDFFDTSIKFEYEQQKLLKILFENAPNQSFNYILQLVEEVIWAKSHDDEATNLKRDYAFGYWRDSDKENRSLIGMFSDFIKTQAGNGSKIFKKFVSAHLNNDSITILELIINGFLQKPKLYKNDFYDFIINFNNKKGFCIDEKIHYKIRRLLSDTYPFFSEVQKEQVNSVLLSIVHKYEIGTYEFKGKIVHNLPKYGETRYKYLCALPKQEIEKNLTLKKYKQELGRKFGQVKDEKQRDSVLRGVPAPFTKTAYDKMSFKDWEHTFMLYDNEKKRDVFSLKGSLREHSRAFKEKVKEEPKRFFPFIEHLILQFTVNEEYIIEGLNGLIDSKYNAVEVLRVFKSTMWKLKERNTILYATWMIRYFIENKVMDKEVFEFMAYHAKNHPDPIKDNDDKNKLMHGANSVRGSIADKLKYCYKFTEHENIIFDTVQGLANDKIVSVQVALFYDIYLLESLNLAKTIAVFKKLIKSKNQYVLKAAMSTANILSFRNYDVVDNYFKNAIKIEELQSDVAKCLFYCWLDGNDSIFPFLESSMEKYHNAKKGVIDIVVECLVSEETNTLNEKAFKIATQYLSETDKEIADEYSSGVLRLKPEHFKITLPFLKEYSDSMAIKLKPGYFYHYLLECCNSFPKDCLDLVQNFDKFSKIDISESGYYDSEIIQIILTCYNKFGDDELDCKQKAVKLFDKTLYDDKFRNNAFKKLNAID